MRWLGGDTPGCERLCAQTVRESKGWGCEGDSYVCVGDLVEPPRCVLPWRSVTSKRVDVSISLWTLSCCVVKVVLMFFSVCGSMLVCNW